MTSQSEPKSKALTLGQTVPGCERVGLTVQSIGTNSHSPAAPRVKDFLAGQPYLRLSAPACAHNQETKCCSLTASNEVGDVASGSSAIPCLEGSRANQMLASTQPLTDGPTMLKVAVEPPVKAEFPDLPWLISLGPPGCTANQYCSETLRSIDFVICLGGDGTIMWVNGLYNGPCPPIVSFGNTEIRLLSWLIDLQRWGAWDFLLLLTFLITRRYDPPHSNLTLLSHLEEPESVITRVMRNEMKVCTVEPARPLSSPGVQVEIRTRLWCTVHNDMRRKIADFITLNEVPCTGRDKGRRVNL
eukprot:762790-Hanusia_phi.AAC.9